MEAANKLQQHAQEETILFNVMAEQEPNADTVFLFEHSLAISIRQCGCCGGFGHKSADKFIARWLQKNQSTVPCATLSAPIPSTAATRAVSRMNQLLRAHSRSNEADLQFGIYCSIPNCRTSSNISPHIQGYYNEKWNSQRLFMAGIKTLNSIFDSSNIYNNFLVLQLRAHLTQFCIICGGIGHQESKCTTKQYLRGYFHSLRKGPLFKQIVQECKRRAQRIYQETTVQINGISLVANNLKNGKLLVGPDLVSIRLDASIDLTKVFTGRHSQHFQIKKDENSANSNVSTSDFSTDSA
jgi:hypothetical protein